MPKKWSEVTSDPSFQALPPDQKEAARQQYFAQVIAPQVGADNVEAAHTQFDQQTRPSPEDDKPAGAFDGENPLQAIGHVGRGLAELGASGVANMGGGVVNAVHDIYHRLTTGDSNADPLVPNISAGQSGQDVLGAVQSVPGVQPAEDLVKSGAGAIEDRFNRNSANFGGDVVRNGLQVLGDAAKIAPVSHLITNPLSAVTQAAEGAGTDWHAAGLRTGQGHPIARAIEDDPASLKIHNEKVGNQIGASEAGTDIDNPVDYDSLSKAREAPNSVYNRLANGFGPGDDAVDLNSDKDTVAAVNSAGTRNNALVAKSEAAQQQIAAQKQLLLQGSMSGDSLINTMRALRQQGFKNAGSQIVADQELGSAQLDMAHALEDHVGRNLPAGGDVDLPQFQAARQALAKNYAVEGALHGNDIDTQALAQIDRSNPGQLTGGLGILARFANAEGRDVTGLAPKFAQPSYPNDLASAINLHRPLTHFVGGLGGRAAARRILTGGTENALQGAAEQFPTRDPNMFAPRDPHGGPLYDADLRRFTTGTGVGPGSDPGAGIPLSHVLSAGVGEGGPEGLSLAPMGIHSEGLPFSAPPESVGAQVVHGGAPQLNRVTDDYGNLHWLDGQEPQGITLGDRIARNETPADRPGAVLADRPTTLDNGPAATPRLSELVDDSQDYPAVKAQGVPDGTAQVAGPRSDPSKPWLVNPGARDTSQESLSRLLDDLQGVEPELPKKRKR